MRVTANWWLADYPVCAYNAHNYPSCQHVALTMYPSMLVSHSMLQHAVAKNMKESTEISSARIEKPLSFI